MIDEANVFGKEVLAVRQVFQRAVSVFLTLVFILSALVTGTYSWQSLQTTTNETAATIIQVRLQEVRLQKLEKLPDGTETDVPVSGAAFYLFSADGKQIGGSLTTDDAGEIIQQLPAGSYYFEESAPPPSFTFDSQNGEPVTTYPFIVTENSVEPVTVTVYNQKLSGSLSVRKMVENADGSPLSEEQLAKDFTFSVAFSDDGIYHYQKSDGTAGELSSDGTLTLRHGETALFENIPDGVTYTVTEQAEEHYIASSTGHRGTIGTEPSEAIFFNTYDPELPPETPVKLTVTKQLAGEYPESDLEKEFEMTWICNGVSEDFTLKPGETKEFALLPGDVYEIREKDYAADGYSQTITGGFGTAGTQDIEVTVTNTYTDTVMKQIAGEKTWRGESMEQAVLPESITIFLKNGGYVVQQATVAPDENGRWLYSFTVPKYDSDGNEIAYTVEEEAPESFRPEYDGFDIINTYIPPAIVTFPSILKTVAGENAPAEHFTFCITAKDNAPMPEGVKNSFLTLSLTGGGELHPGEICYTNPGTYVYTVTETETGLQGWIYDTSVYTVTVTVTETDGALTADTVITKEDGAVSRIEFVNRYDSEIPPHDITVVEGQKTWVHGDNPEEERPDSIVVLIYGDGEIVLQQQITEEDGWHYRFELPKYNGSGKEILYTVDEAGVENYEKVVEGYDLINTYRPNTPPEPSDPGEPNTPPEPGDPGEPSDSSEPSTSPTTGDNSNIWLWFVLMLVSGGMLVVLGRKRKAQKEESEIE